MSRHPLLLQLLALGALGGAPMAEASLARPERPRQRSPEPDPVKLDPWSWPDPELGRRPRHVARPKRRTQASGYVQHPDWRFPRCQRWARACPTCKREVAQTLKVCDQGHKAVKTRRVLLAK